MYDELENKNPNVCPSLSPFEDGELLRMFIPTFSWNNYDFTIHDRKRLVNGDLKGYYRCKYYRSKCCKAKLVVICSLIDDDYQRTFSSTNEHICGVASKFAPAFEEPLNIQAEMRAFVEDRCLLDSSTATIVSRLCLDHFHTKYSGKI